MSAAEPPCTEGTSSSNSMTPLSPVSAASRVRGSESVESIRTATCTPARGSPLFDEKARSVSWFTLPGRISSGPSRTSTR